MKYPKQHVLCTTIAVFLLAVGTSLPAAAHHGADGFSVIHFDTHADTGEIYEDGPLPDHGQPFSRAVEEGVLLGGNIVQVGLRGCWPFPEEFDRMREQGFRWYTMAQIDERGLRAVLDETIAHARERAPRTYLTVDVDSLDPAYAPGTGTPEPGGLTSREPPSALGVSAHWLDPLPDAPLAAAESAVSAAIGGVPSGPQKLTFFIAGGGLLRSRAEAARRVL
jgi:hypothetical protein